jgi:hypothetical protein
MNEEYQVEYLFCTRFTSLPDGRISLRRLTAIGEIATAKCNKSRYVIMRVRNLFRV